MPLHDVLADRQPQPRSPCLLGGIEGLEDMREMLSGNSDAVVADDKFDRGIRRHPRADPQVALLRHGIEGVDHDGQHHLLDLRWIAMRHGQIGGKIQVELNARHVHLVLHQAQATIDDLVKIAPGKVHGGDPREAQQVLHQLAAALAFAGNKSSDPCISSLRGALAAFFSIQRLTSLEYARIPESGLLISWATMAAILPMVAIFSTCSMRWWACLSSRVFSSTRNSRLCPQASIAS